jgi:hypothetical protein
VDELAAVLEASDLFIGADSGPAHLAAAVGTPAVVLFSGTNDPRQWQPCGEAVRVLRQPVPCSPCHRTRCPWADHPCMRRLTPNDAAAAVEDLASSGRETTWGLSQSSRRRLSRLSRSENRTAPFANREADGGIVPVAVQQNVKTAVTLAGTLTQPQSTETEPESK